ncbi:MAG: NAD-dependent epimerase/dehydratase family protein [Prevotellaceae bacterium]|jgi:UDP-glucose 4-epimerase|nr:NAD-dependent epimerase/dehydratase family protein [Prevotellaceae bacterium]
MRTVLLGGSGFIGYHIAKNLYQQDEVVVVDIGPRPAHFAFPGLQYVQGNCADRSFLRHTIQPDDNILFLAYNSVPKTSFDDPIQDITENLPIAVNLLAVLKDVPVRRMIYFSSGGTVYGHTKEHAPIGERHATNPISPYGITKLAIEKYCKMYSALFHIPIVILRPSNPFGEYQIPFRGQGFIATAMAKILKDEEITIFGNHGTVRDYIYINDLVSATIHLLKTDMEKNVSVFNIGSGTGLTNVDVIRRIAAVARKKFSALKILFLPERDFDVPYNVLDATKLKNTGWEMHTSFDEGVAQTWRWICNFMK